MVRFSKLSLRQYVAVALGSTLTAIPSLAAFAQSTEVDYDEYEPILEEVIVTGTRIRLVDGYGRSSPVTVVGMDEIESFGYTRIEDVLNNMPQFEVADTSFDSNGASGTATLSLRGLGTKRTLVMINGRRMQPGGIYSYAADVNQIPSQMIERVEVLTGGASATYGADAVAGVVNFIMRRVDGVEISAGISGYQHDNSNAYIQGLMDEKGYDYPTGNSGLDGKTYNASIVLGGDFDGGRGNATVYATWRKNDALQWGARDYSSCSLRASATACGGSWVATEIPNFFIAPLSEDGWGPYGYDYFQEQFLVLQPDSSLMVDDWVTTSNLYNFAPINYYMRPDERWSLGALADYEINQHAVVYLETMYANDQTRAQIAETGTFMVDVYPLPLDNAYFPENFKQSLAELWPGEDDFGVYIGKRNVEGGPRSEILEHSGFRIVAGVKGVLTGDWDYDISYLYAQTDSSSTYVNDFLLSKIRPAVDSTLCEADRSCIPYQVFTYQGVTPEAADSLEGTAVSTSTTETDIFQAYVTGDTGWGLDAGNIMAVAGYEHRKVAFERRPDSISEQGDLAGWILELPSLAGGYSVNELFIETKIPLLADHRFSRDMVLDLAYRWSDYSTSGGSSTYRVGLDWQIVDWLRLRTGYNRAVRAPNIGELFEPQLLVDFPGEDPCAGGTPAYTLEQCARSGVTAQQYGNIAPAPSDDWRLNALFGGNPDLDPEEADTFTAGLVFEIGDAMQLSIDYWDIQIEDAIEGIWPGVALEQCLQFGRLCDLVKRAPGSGSLWRSPDGYIYAVSWNLGELHSRGVDAAWNWSPGVNWSFGLIGSYYLKKEKTIISGAPETSYDCAGLANNDDCDEGPKWRHIATATYDSGGSWALTARWRYFGDITYEGEMVDQIAAKSLQAQSYFDLSGVIRFMGTHDLTLGVNNILDEEPPLLGAELSQSANSNNRYDLLGRYLFANVTLRW